MSFSFTPIESPSQHVSQMVWPLVGARILRNSFLMESSPLLEMSILIIQNIVLHVIYRADSLVLVVLSKEKMFLFVCVIFRQMILTGCVAFARHVGPTRVEAELLPQCWEQVNLLGLP